MTNIEDSINILRKKIDAIDAELVNLLKERSEIVDEVGHLKHKLGGAKSMVRPGREAVMIRNVVKRDIGKFPKIGAAYLWRLIISASISLEEKITILVDRNDSEVNAPVANYYAGILETAKKNNIKEVLNAVAKNKTFIGVIPARGAFFKEKWCRDLFAKDIKVFGILPFFFDKTPKQFYLLVGRVTPEATGEDVSLFISKTGLVKKSGFITEAKGMIYAGSYAKEFKVGK